MQVDLSDDIGLIWSWTSSVFTKLEFMICRQLFIFFKIFFNYNICTWYIPQWWEVMRSSIKQIKMCVLERVVCVPINISSLDFIVHFAHNEERSVDHNFWLYSANVSRQKKQHRLQHTPLIARKRICAHQRRVVGNR